MNPILSVFNERLNENDPNSAILNGCLPQFNFILSIEDFFRTKEFADLGLDISRWTLFETESKNILDNIIDTVKNCVTSLVEFDKVLREELSAHETWTYSSISKLIKIAHYKECRNFLHVVSSSKSLVSSTCIDSSHNMTTIIRDFDDAVIKFLSNLVLFLQGESIRTVFDNEKGEMSDFVTKAKKINGFIDSLVATANILKGLNTIEYQTILDNLNGLNFKLTHLVEKSKKEPVRRGERLEPSEEELNQTNNKKFLRRWYERYNDLKAYRKKHGHCNVPRKDPNLGNWVDTQRKQKKKYQEGSKTPMTHEKIQHLEDLNFKWNTNDAEWNKRFEELKEYYDTYGDCKVPRSTPKLGLWVKDQRNNKRSRAAHTEERRTKLRKLGSFHY